MTDDQKRVSAAEARKAVRDISRRVGLLHMCYARTLVNELGEERGRELIKKAIWDYGTKIGERVRERVVAMGLEPTLENMGKGSDLSPIGFDHRSVEVDGEPRDQFLDCALAEPWMTYDEQELGGLYCLVDPAKTQAYNPNYTMVHVFKILNGHPHCEIAIRPVGQEDE
jgi:hypothetical protein